MVKHLNTPELKALNYPQDPVHWTDQEDAQMQISGFFVEANDGSKGLAGYNCLAHQNIRVVHWSQGELHNLDSRIL